MEATVQLSHVIWVCSKNQEARRIECLALSTTSEHCWKVIEATDGRFTFSKVASIEVPRNGYLPKAHRKSVQPRAQTSAAFPLKGSPVQHSGALKTGVPGERRMRASPDCTAGAMEGYNTETGILA